MQKHGVRDFVGENDKKSQHFGLLGALSLEHGIWIQN
jgi:hypothetical protein